MMRLSIILLQMASTFDALSSETCYSFSLYMLLLLLLLSLKLQTENFKSWYVFLIMDYFCWYAILIDYYVTGMDLAMKLLNAQVTLFFLLPCSLLCCASSCEMYLYIFPLFFFLHFSQISKGWRPVRVKSMISDHANLGACKITKDYALITVFLQFSVEIIEVIIFQLFALYFLLVLLNSVKRLSLLGLDLFTQTLICFIILILNTIHAVPIYTILLPTVLC